MMDGAQPFRRFITEGADQLSLNGHIAIYR